MTPITIVIGIKANSRVMPPSKYSAVDAHSIPLLSDNQPEDEERTPDSSTDPLYPPVKPPRRPVLNRYSWIIAAALLLIFIGLLAVPKPSGPDEQDEFDDGYDENGPVPDIKKICVQPAVKTLPDDELSRQLAATMESEDYLRKSVERMTGAVRVRTESFDDMGPVGEDPRWDVFGEFHEFLERTFPRVYFLAV